MSSQDLISEIQGITNFIVKYGSIQTQLDSRPNECCDCLELVLSCQVLAVVIKSHIMHFVF